MCLTGFLVGEPQAVLGIPRISPRRPPASVYNVNTSPPRAAEALFEAILCSVPMLLSLLRTYQPNSPKTRIMTKEAPQWMVPINQQANSDKSLELVLLVPFILLRAGVYPARSRFPFNGLPQRYWLCHQSIPEPWRPLLGVPDQSS